METEMLTRWSCLESSHLAMEVNIFQVRGLERTLDLESESPHLNISLPAPPKWPGGDPFAEGWLASHSE